MPPTMIVRQVAGEFGIEITPPHKAVTYITDEHETCGEAAMRDFAGQLLAWIDHHDAGPYTIREELVRTIDTLAGFDRAAWRKELSAERQAYLAATQTQSGPPIPVPDPVERTIPANDDEPAARTGTEG